MSSGICTENNNKMVFVMIVTLIVTMIIMLTLIVTVIIMMTLMLYFIVFTFYSLSVRFLYVYM